MRLELERAILDNEIVPFYQPIVRLMDRTTIGHEALLRWSSPNHGLLGPNEFLKAAEEAGMIEALDWTIFSETIRCASLLPGKYISINVSPRHFLREDLETRLTGLIRTAGISPDQIRIEITEETLIENHAQLVDVLNRLKKIGLVAMIDDFGSGFSSLSYAYRLPVGTLKLDRSIVADLCTERAQGSEAVARAVLALARSLDIEVVAEGIETEHQLDRLIKIGYVFGQGFLLGRPAPLEAIANTGSH